MCSDPTLLAAIQPTYTYVSLCACTSENSIISQHIKTALYRCIIMYTPRLLWCCNKQPFHSRIIACRQYALWWANFHIYSFVLFRWCSLPKYQNKTIRILIKLKYTYALPSPQVSRLMCQTICQHKSRCCPVIQYSTLISRAQGFLCVILKSFITVLAVANMEQ